MVVNVVGVFLHLLTLSSFAMGRLPNTKACSKIQTFYKPEAVFRAQKIHAMVRVSRTKDVGTF